MAYNKVEFVVLITVILLQSYRTTVAYTQISTSGSRSGDDGGPKIYRAVNFDLIYPKSFNSSENVISTTPETIPLPAKTATSVVGQPHYPLPQSNEPATYTAATATATATTVTKQLEPTLFVTLPPQTEPNRTPLPAASSNEALIYDAQENMPGNKYTAQVVTQNAINMQQKQQNQLLQQQQTQQQQQEQPYNNKNAKKEEQQYFATGRAVDYHTVYPFGQVITPLIKTAPRPVYRKPVTSHSTFLSSPSSSSSLPSPSLAAARSSATASFGNNIQPQAGHQQKPPSQAEIDKLHGKGKFTDRFSPSEGVVSHSFKSNNDHSHDHHNHALSYQPIRISNPKNSDEALSNLYAFPPNNVNYPTQPQDSKAALPSGTVNSYAWPASGSLKNSDYNLNAAVSNTNPYQYNGPVSPEYSPSLNEGKSEGNMDDYKHNDSDANQDTNVGDDSSVGVLPASAMDQENQKSNDDMFGGMADSDMGVSINSPDDKTPDDNSYDTEKEYPTPPPGWLKAHPESVQEHPHQENNPKKPDIEFVHNVAHHQPDIIFDHDHDQYQHYFPSYPSYAIHHHNPHLIYDDHPHDHHYIEHHPSPTTTTEAPPPEPVPEPRVKKYSYFYIGRKLWYIPLYFTVWFSFYVLWLILKSIARHKVNLPNHYVARRSVDNYDSFQRQQEIINQLAVSVLDKIDKFKTTFK